MAVRIGITALRLMMGTWTVFPLGVTAIDCPPFANTMGEPAEWGSVGNFVREGHNDGKKGDIVWRDGSNRLFPTSRLNSAEG